MIRFYSGASRTLLRAVAIGVTAVALTGCAGDGAINPTASPTWSRGVEMPAPVPVVTPAVPPPMRPQPALAQAVRPWSVETMPAPTPVALTSPAAGLESGIASYYWQDQMTASGERFDRRAMTAAHRTLPFGTMVRVTSTKTGKGVAVRINDRGPFKPGRIIDLSEAAAEQIEMTKSGLVSVTVERMR